MISSVSFGRIFNIWFRFYIVCVFVYNLVQYTGVDTY